MGCHQFNYHLMTDFIRDTCITRTIISNDFTRLFEGIFYNITEYIENITEMNMQTYKKISGFWDAYTAIPFYFYSFV